MNNIHNQILDIEGKISDLKSQLPAHSTPITMRLVLEELEEQLEKLRSQQADEGIEDA